MRGQHPVDKILDTRPVALVDEAVVDRHRALLRLDERAVDSDHFLSDHLRHAPKQIREPGALLALEPSAFGAPDIKAVAARNDEIVDPHQLLHHSTITPTDHAHRAPMRQRTHDLAHLVRNDRVLRPIDDRRERPVVIEEHRNALASHPLAQTGRVVEGVRQPANLCAIGAHREHPLAAAVMRVGTLACI